MMINSPTRGLAKRARNSANLALARPRLLFAATKAGALGGMATTNASAGSATTTSTTNRTRHRTPSGWAVSNLRVAYPNWSITTPGNGEVSGANDINVKAAIEFGSTSYPLFFNGASTVTIKPDAAPITDPLGVRFPAGSTIYDRTYVSLSSGTWPLGRLASGNSGDGANGNNGSDITASTGSSGITASQYLYGPSAIIGYADTPLAKAVYAVGDSIASGVTENNNGDADGNMGFVERGLSNRFGWATWTRSGMRFEYFNNAWRGAAWGARYATSVICELGINDIRNGASLATLQARAITAWTTLAAEGAAVYQTTTTPEVTTTDGYCTLAGQTIANAGQNTVRVSWNDWLRGGAPISGGVAVAVGTAGALLAGQTGHPLTGYIEIADAVESARNSGLYAVSASARTFSDGAITSGTANLTSASANFTSADVGVGVFVPGAGSAGAALTTTIKSVTNSTTVVLAVNASTTVSGAAVKLGGLVADGLHPNTAGHILAAAVIAAFEFQ